MASEEDVWVSRAKAGDQAAFEALVQRYERQIYGFVYRMMGDADDAYDLTQDCFVRAFKSLPGTNSDLNISAWLHRIASNACLDVLRRRQKIRWLRWDSAKHDNILEAHESDDPERRTVAFETSNAVQETLNKMSARNRLALVLREYEGLSCEEIGEVMGISRSAVKSILFRGRDEFRKLYVEAHGEVA
jgi:RNA polymerase sigma-70 factor (ECF subfamily)